MSSGQYTRERKEDKPVLAICYDFDKTLSPDDMQAQGYIQSVGYDVGEFWTESNELAVKNDMDQNLAYMLLMKKKAAGKVLFTRKALEEYGAKVTLFPGVEDWFERVRTYGAEHGVIVEHYSSPCTSPCTGAFAILGRETSILQGGDLMYLERFTLPDTEQEEALIMERICETRDCAGFVDNPYPCRLFPARGLRELYFQNMTILYGGNGSGKSTLLNLIAEKLKLNRIAPFNSGEMVKAYVDACRYEMAFDEEGFRHTVPDGSRIITSDDVFDYMLTVRTNNDEIGECREEARDQWGTLRYGNTVKFRGMEDYDTVRIQLLARSRSVSRKQFIRRVAGEEVKLNSNGETALRYFDERLKSDRLYCLDEPENSLSPKRQQELAAMLEQLARYCGCQFIIATHSPFLLAMNNARIYNLDAAPAQVQSWWELENTKLYYRFFKQHRELFE